MNYFDACYIAKFYLAEPDSPNVIAFAQAQSPVCCLLSGKAEVVSVFHRKLREGAVDAPGFALLCDQFEADCAAGLWMWFGQEDALVDSVTRRIRTLPATIFLRAADAFHLTCAAEKGCAEIYTSDRHMTAAAPAFGLQAVKL